MQFLSSTRLAWNELRATALRLLSGGTDVSVPPAATVRQLEDRLLFSVVPAAVVGDCAVDESANLLSADDAADSATDALADDPSDSRTDSESDSGTPATDRYEVIFVDTSVSDYEQLLDHLSQLCRDGAEYETILLDSERDGVEQITAELSERDGIDALHIISHGTARAVKLGSTWLTAENIGSFQSDVQSWGQALDDQADLLLYGCDLASGDTGRDLLQQLATLTGTDLAASTDTTGHARFGGDWDLEFRIGDVTSQVVVSTDLQQQWNGLLDTFTVTSQGNAGAGSLRQAITDANALPGLDVITFSLPGPVPYDISVNTALPDITDPVIIDGTSEPDYAGTPVIGFTDGGAVVANNGFVFTATASGSVVKGLAFHGFANNAILLQAGADNISITGNYLGLDETGAAVANGYAGIEILSANNVVGGAAPADANVISGNGYAGIVIRGSSANNNRVLGNLIGTDVTGTVAIGNVSCGVVVANGASGTVIGGTAAGQGNIITGSALGVLVDSNVTPANAAILGNRIFGNSGLGIDLQNDGVTANDAGDADAGPNGLQNYPVLASATSVTGDLTVSGSLASTTLTTYRIEFFCVPTGDATGHGEADKYLGSTNVTTDAAGNASFNVTLIGAAVSIGHVVTATATVDLGSGNYSSTSEFAANVVNTGVNTAPVASGDSYTINEDTPLVIAAPGLLANDSDVDGDPLTAVQVSGPANGALTLNANGSFNYTPNTDFQGTDSFTYRASDGTAQSNLATVSITVNAVNDVPVANNESYTINEDTPLVIAAPGLLANDSDIDGDPLTAVQVSGPANGALTLDANGSFTYTPNANFQGTDSFTYRASDGTAQSNLATVTITVNAVNDVPVANNDSYTINEDTPLNIAAPGLLANDSDIDGDPLTAVQVSGPANGALTLNANGSFTYTPNANFQGTDSFTYRASDGTAQSNLATVSITVNAVNDVPVANNESYTINEDTPLVIAAPGLLANDSDIDGDPLTAVQVSGPTNGALTLNANGSFTYTPNANFQGTDSFTYRASDGTAQSNLATVTITVNAVNDVPVANNDSYTINEDTPLNIAAPGLLANDSDIDGDPLTAVQVSGPANGALTLNANGSFNYTPNAHFQGTDSFTYRASDGTAQSNVVTVAITVNAVNDVPVASGESYTINEDTPLNIAALGLLANDSDIDGDPLTAVQVSGPTNGALTLNADGSFTYTPNANFQGTDSFTYRASDGTAQSNLATVTITVNAVNDVPVANNDSYTINEDTPLVIVAPGLLANDSDVDGDPLTAVQVSGPTNGALTLNANGSFTYTPNANFQGTDSFTYRASDGTAQSNLATVSITVNAVNDVPVASGESYTINEDTPLVIVAPGLLANDSDIDGDPLTAVPVSGPANGALTLNANGSFNYTPNAHFHGTDSFTYRASDGTAQSNVVTVAITVNAVNDAPVANGESYTINEDTPLIIVAPGLLANDSDVDGDPLTAVQVSGPTNGALTLNANGSFNYTPNAHFQGTDSFTYRASDGTAQSNLATVTITVNAVNDVPVANNESYTINEDTPLSIAAPGLLANDSDIDGDPLTAVPVSGPANGALTLNANGSFNYTPNAHFHGTDSFTYRASDGTAQSNVVTVAITVNAVNDAPVALNDVYTVQAGETLVIPWTAGVLVNDYDAENDPLTAVLASGPMHGTVSLNADGSFQYVSDANCVGVVTFAYYVSDGISAGNVALVSILVQPNLIYIPQVEPPRGNGPPGNAELPPRPDSPPPVPTQPPPPAPGGTAPAGAQPPRTGDLVASAEELGAAVVEAEKDRILLARDERTVSESDAESIAAPTRNASIVRTGNSRGAVRSSGDMMAGGQSGTQFEATSVTGSGQAYVHVAASRQLWQELDAFRDDVDGAQQFQIVAIGSVGTIASGFTVGYVLWALRSGLLLSSLLASMPAWTLLDPLAIASVGDGSGRDDQEESLEQLVERRAREVSEGRRVQES